MAIIFPNSFFPRKLFLAFLLVTILASAHAKYPSIKVSSSLVNFVCSRSSNPPLCVKVLTSDPRSAKANSLKDLGFISIDAAESQAKSTQTLIGTLLPKATDPKVKAQLNACQEFYKDSVADLEQGRKDLNADNFRESGSFVSAANAGADSCDERFAGSNAPEPAELKEANLKLKDLTGITLIVTAFSLIPPPPSR